MIAELSAQNFKSWEDTGKLQFAPLTGFFGANNSGKTSILQLLLLLKQTVERPPEWNEPLYFGSSGSPVNLVDFDTLIHRHKQDLSLGISVSWESSIGADIDQYIRRRDMRLPSYVTIQPSSRVYQDPLDEISFSTNIARSQVNNFYYETDRNKLDVGLSTDQFRCYGLRTPLANTRGIFSRLFSRLEEDFKNLFSRVHYLGPRRADPRHDYSWRESHPKDIGRRGEKMIPALLSSRVQNRAIDEQIVKWLQELDLIDSYTINSISDTEQDYELLIKQYKDGPEVGLTDVGFGVSQVLPLIAQCYYAPEGSILILENPEAHLHPKVQSELADVLIDVVKNRNVQIILESHSEHLLLRLMRRIAEEKISADQTAFHFCEIKDGNSRAEQLKVDEYGNISNWPQNFFGDDMGDLAEKTKAEMKRRKANK